MIYYVMNISPHFFYIHSFPYPTTLPLPLSIHCCCPFVHPLSCYCPPSICPQPCYCPSSVCPYLVVVLLFVPYFVVVLLFVPYLGVVLLLFLPYLVIVLLVLDAEDIGVFIPPTVDCIDNVPEPHSLPQQQQQHTVQEFVNKMEENYNILFNQGS